MNGNLTSKNSNICFAYIGKGCSLLPYCISTIHGGHVGEGREHDYREVGGRATQEAKADDYREVGGRATQEAKADDYREVGGRMKWEPESRSGSVEILRNSGLNRAPLLLTWVA